MRFGKGDAQQPTLCRDQGKVVRLLEVEIVDHRPGGTEASEVQENKWVKGKDVVERGEGATGNRSASVVRLKV